MHGPVSLDMEPRTQPPEGPDEDETTLRRWSSVHAADCAACAARTLHPQGAYGSRVAW